VVHLLRYPIQLTLSRPHANHQPRVPLLPGPSSRPESASQQSTQPLPYLGRAVAPSSASEARRNITGKFELPRPARHTRAAADFPWANRVSEPSTPQN